MSAAIHAKARAAVEEPWLATLTRVLVHAVGAAVFSWPLTRPGAVFAAALGAGVGALLGPVVARTRLRTAPMVGAFLGGFLVASLAHAIVVDTDWLAPSLGPAAALQLGDALFFGLAALSASGLLRAISARRRPLAVLEVGFVGVAFAQLVVAHRHGAINRPFAIADPILAAGGDPTHVFLVVGALATTVVVLLLLSEKSVGRSIFHLGVVAALLLLIAGTTEMLGLPPPPPSGGGLGLRPDENPDEQDADGAHDRPERNNEELEFRDNYDSSNNRVPVGVVLFHDDYSPPSGVYYFRQGAFSQYNGRRLVNATRQDVDSDIARGFPSEPTDIAGAPVATAASSAPPEVRVLGLVPPVAAGIRAQLEFAAWTTRRATVETTVALLADHTRPFALEAPMRLEPAPNPNSGRFRRTYRVTSGAITADFRSMLDVAAGSPAWPEEVWRHYTRAPEDPRYASLANQVIQDALPPDLREKPVARVLALTDWLGETGTYSLQSRHAGSEDPTASFLFGDQTGYCVHFAHAAAYMMRSVGLPARVATGYAIDESARQGGSALLVSGENSHAWPEIYLEGYGWVVVDVSPQTVDSPAPQPPDADLQRLLGELARGQSPVPPDADRAIPEAIASAREIGLFLGRSLGALLLLAFAFLVLAKLWRGLVPLVARRSARPRVLYRAQLDRLSELSLRRHRGESREAFARRVRDKVPSLVAITRVHVGAAFGSQRIDEDIDGLAIDVQKLRAELRAAFPWWRRVLGVLTPWSWLTSR